MKIETKTADAILERKHNIEIGNNSYKMPQPTLATMLMVSEASSELPDLFDQNLSIIDWAMKNADKARTLARILAIFILGANRINEGKKVAVERKEMSKERKFLWIKRKSKYEIRTVFVDEQEWIEDLILETMSPKELALALYHCMSLLEVKDFFQVTASLSGVNLTKRTEAVIQSGD